MRDWMATAARAALVLVLTMGSLAADEAANLETEAQALLGTIRLSVKFRKNMLAVRNRLDKRDALSRTDHIYIERSAGLFLRIDERLEERVTRYADALGAPESPDRTRRLVLYAAALKTRYENAAALVRLADNDLAYWRYDKVKVEEGFIRSVRARFADSRTAASLVELKKALAEARTDLAGFCEGDVYDELVALAVEAPSLAPVEEGIVADTSRWISAKSLNLGLALGGLLDEVVYGASKVFGNAAGSVRFLGEPKIAGKVKTEVVAEVKALVRPGDILLDKTGFALTDRLIPGYFGHVAVWLGSPDEIEGQSLLDPAVNPHFKDDGSHWEAKAGAGAGVLEALRSGVTLNTLEHFCHLDDIVVLRIREAFLRKENRVSHLRRAVQWLGTPYDFNFDVNTSDKIVCSELVYQIYPIAWPTTASVGRRTISPDQVASQCGPTKDFPLELVYWCRAGERLAGEEGYRAFWQSLVSEGVALPDGPRGDALRALGVTEAK